MQICISSRRLRRLLIEKFESLNRPDNPQCRRGGAFALLHTPDILFRSGRSIAVSSQVRHSVVTHQAAYSLGITSKGGGGPIRRILRRWRAASGAFGKTASIRLSPIRCTSEDVAWNVTEPGVGANYGEEWGLQVDATKLETERMIVLWLAAAGIEIKLEV